MEGGKRERRERKKFFKKKLMKIVFLQMVRGTRAGETREGGVETWTKID